METASFQAYVEKEVTKKPDKDDFFKISDLKWVSAEGWLMLTATVTLLDDDTQKPTEETLKMINLWRTEPELAHEGLHFDKPCTWAKDLDWGLVDILTFITQDFNAGKHTQAHTGQ